MKKRGQIQQLFVYIFALIVGAMIIIFGYYVITNVLKLGKEVETAKFKQDFKEQIGLYYTYTPNTNGNVQIKTPSGIKGICFIVEGEASEIKYTDVKEIVEISDDENVYFSTTKEGVNAKPFSVDKFKPNPDPLCINTLKGFLDIDLITTGNYVEISEHKA